MICPDCNGNDDRCFRCGGIGNLCDVCGEVAEDAGLDWCKDHDPDKEESE